MTFTATSTLKDGQYSLTASIGQGIFSKTYQGIECKSEQPVIIKTLGKSLVTHPNFEEFKDKFLQLAQRFRTCRHENLVSLLDVFVENGQPYIVYEFITGQDLATLIKKTGSPSPQKAEQYIQQIGRAIEVIHYANLQHLDIKPENIILQDKTDKVILVDYGLTCQLTPEICQTHCSLASSGCAPIEHYLPEVSSSTATDIYSLAATLFNLITGKEITVAPLRANKTVPKELRNSFKKDIRALKLDPALKKAIFKGLAIKAQERPQNIQEWLELLLQVQVHKKERIVLSSNSSQRHKNFNGTNKSNKNRKIKVKLAKKAKYQYPFKALLMTSTAAAFVGLGFGLAIRLNRPEEAGSSIFHTEQSFPERSNWKVEDHKD